MKTILAISMVSFVSGNAAFAEQCSPKHYEGYFCEKVGTDFILVLRTTKVDDNFEYCAREAIANFGLNQAACLSTARGLND